MENIQLNFVSDWSPYYNSDWGYAFDRAGVNRDDVAIIYAADEGQNDVDSWIAAGQLKDGRWFFATAWCDYTGWDCRAGGEMFINEDKEQLERFNMSDADRSRLGIVLPEIEGVKPIATDEENS